MKISNTAKRVILIVIIAFVVFVIVSVLIVSLRPRYSSPDNRRLSDITTFQSALELYMKDHKDYPNELKELVPIYLAEVFSSPQQLTSEFCNEENNKYLYKKISTSFYEITFCTGMVGGYNEGIHKATADGIH